MGTFSQYYSVNIKAREHKYKLHSLRQHAFINYTLLLGVLSDFWFSVHPEGCHCETKLQPEDTEVISRQTSHDE